MIMNRSLKRYRQASILESIIVNKRGKGECNCTVEAMDKDADVKSKSELREVFASAAENRAAIAKRNNLNSEFDGDSSPVSSCSTVVYEPSLTEPTTDFSPSSEDLFPEEDSASSFSAAKEKSRHLAEEHFTNGETSEEVKTSVKFNRIPKCQLPLPPLVSSAAHAVLFRYDLLKPGFAPPPYPSKFTDKWDSDHVRMPCSPENVCVVLEEDGSKSIQNRWEVIEKSLLRDFKSSHDLQEAILQYNCQYANRWDFNGLHAFFSKCIDQKDRELFFKSILPSMARLALQLPQICTQPIPLLKNQMTHSITLSQKQIGCLLCNAFFCTFPKRTITAKGVASRKHTEYRTYPDINFNRLYIGVGNKDRISPRSSEKFKCLLNYFHRITKKDPTGTVTFYRQYLKDFPHWSSSQCKMRSAVVDSDGVIENEGFGMLQVDFANKYVGGGVLGFGCVQEEIRFVICPELIISRLFTEVMATEEVLIISGVEQYNRYSGYGDSFKWGGDFSDSTVRDSWGRKCTQLVAMDALSFRSAGDQFKTSCIIRELNKAYCGFFEGNTPPENLPTIATGNWGCGVYKGNNILKFLIQLMAASEAKRDILYFTFHDPKLQKDIENIHRLIVKRNLNVGDLWTMIIRYEKKPSGQLRRPAFSKHVIDCLLHDDLKEKFINDDPSSVEDENDLKAIECMLKDSDFEIEM